MKLPFTTYDVFTSRKLAGNPLAIVEDADALTTGQMQTIAREFNLSETIFVRAPQDAANTASVRIFFPTAEIPFAGHPTIGCAIHLAAKKYKEGCSFETEIRLEEVAGLVPVKVSRIGDVPRAQFTAPVVPFAVDHPLPTVGEVARALGLAVSDIGFDGHGPGLFEGGPRFFYVPLNSRGALARAKPHEPHWSAMVSAMDIGNAYLYARGGDGADTSFRARMYAPGDGIPEDPATGSATALLAAQLLAAEKLADGTHRFKLEQGYEMGRPSDLWLEADVAGAKLSAVRVAGQAVQIMSGVLEI
ncbi:PhzF family phenazine biosynthesis protein [Aestuariivirga sp.]|uniref:PhzF family phenazine biosynthesis protein n=1 Tax=Aestuariivirga sp. TaxID=2650926 RepID=UPI0025C71EA7|nr:PhzF family phenazine biosynthesis protein [Aestuariivirga sp.]MCA3556441.1 PhzF family phenazine biosynthesis protein [Aestuariivirga sp.]